MKGIALLDDRFESFLDRSTMFFFNAFVEFVSDTLEEGKARGIVRQEVDSRMIAWQFLGIGLTKDRVSDPRRRSDYSDPFAAIPP